MPTPIPFSEPSWLLGLPSPIFKETHRKWQASVRAFVEKNLLKDAMEWEKAEAVPPHVFETFAKANMLVACLPAPLPVVWLKRLGIHELLGGLKVEDFDYLHGLIYAVSIFLDTIFAPCRTKHAPSLAYTSKTLWLQVLKTGYGHLVAHFSPH
jgi:acyl-CoA dehydrogenase